MDKIRLLIIDKNMETVEIEINKLQFRSLGIDYKSVKKFDSKRNLNVEITRFLESFKED